MRASPSRPRHKTAPARAGAVFACAVVLAAAAGSSAVVVAAPHPAALYRDGPPLGFAGGFGEDTCQACHFDADVDQGPGSVDLAGVPTAFGAGETYPLTLTVTQPGVGIGGFMLTARFSNGGQAGLLSASADDAGRVARSTDSESGVQYAHHTVAGSALVAPDTARWTVIWTSPAETSGRVLFHVAASAADGDDSATGDFVYTAIRESGLPGPADSVPAG